MSLLFETLAAIIGTISFSLLFGVPKKFYPYCGFIGGAGWIVYAVLLKFVSTPMSAMIATIVVILFSRMFAVRERCPVTIFLISGIFPLVPGAGVYWTAYYIVTDELNLAARTGFLALKVAVAIVLGIVFVFELPQGIFKFAAKKPIKTEERKERENKDDLD